MDQAVSRPPSACARLFATPQADARSRRAAQRRRRDDPALPRRFAGQMAPRPHDLVFRDLRAARSRRPATARSTSAWPFLFNSYYEGEGPRHARPKRGMLSRPSLDEIRAYRAHVDEALERALPSLPPTALELIELGINHEQQHQELFLTDILATFAENPLEPAYGELPPPACFAVEPLSFQPGREGVVEIGAADDGFAFDSERPRHRVFLAAARDRQPPGDQPGMARVHRRRRLSHADPVAVRRLGLGPARGHRRSALLARRRDRVHPRRPPRDRLGRAGRARQLLRGRRVRPLGRRAAPDRSRMGRFRRLGRPEPRQPARRGRRGRAAPRRRHVRRRLGMDRRAPSPPTPASRPPKGAVGEYNGKFMCGQFVLKGASCATPRGHSRASYRNFFPPSARWQFTGLRLARDA